MATRAPRSTAAAEAEMLFTPAPPQAPAQPWGTPVQQSGAILVPETESDDDDVLTRVRALVDQFGGDAVNVKIYKRGQVGFDWVDDCSLAVFEEGGLTMVRQRYGAGKFELRIYGPGGLVARPKFSIAEIAQPLTAQAPAMSGELALMLKSVADTQAAMLQTLREVTARPQADPQAAMRDAFALMRDMREAMGINNAPAPAVAPPAPLSALNDALALVRGLREASAELSPEKAAEDSPMAMLSPLVELVKTAMARGQNSAELAPLAMPASLSEAHAENPVQETQTGNDEMLKQMLIAGAVAKLEAMAKANAPHSQGGDFIARNMPDEMIGAFELPNWFEILCEALPKHAATLRTHRAWIEGAKLEADKLLNDNSPG